MSAVLTYPTGLPWPEPALPTYREGGAGEWTLARTQPVRNTAGYFLPIKYQPKGWVIRRGGQNVWMSLARMEVESHMPHLAAARGRVVVMGLGMGFALYNIARKPEVESVVVVERSGEIVALLDATTGWRRWPGHRKVRLEMGNALDYRPGGPVDFLYADIWPKVGDSRALTDTQAMQANVRAAAVGYWTQEYDYVHFAGKHIARGPGAYRRFARETGLPLIEQDNPRYPSLAFAAVALQLAAGTKDMDDRERLMRRWLMFLTERTVDPIAAAIGRAWSTP